LLLFGAVADFPALPESSAGGTRSYVVRPDDARNRVQFDAHTPTETYSGVTQQVEGSLTLDPERPTDATATLAVELNTLKTGVGLRDRQMRERYLETDRYPRATFTLQQVSSTMSGPLTPERATLFRATGTFSLHGVERPLSLQGTLTRVTEEVIGGQRFPTETLHIVTSFSVRLDNYKIRTPRFLFLAVGQTHKVTVDLWAVVPRGRR
jgi:polyisoprenoid-binding protein YceI